MQSPRTRVIFVISSDHSGSTWIGYVLGSTPHSAFLGEFHRAWNASQRVPCTVCAARSLPACAVFHNIDACPAAAAFSFAAERTGRRVLIDNSKRLDWAISFLAAPDLDCRVVHLVRDPRGWFASARRRGRTDLAAAIAFWCLQNRAFHDFTRACGQAGMTVCYDTLATGSQHQFGVVFDFCGLPFSEASLRYWNVEHHGYAANGASDAMLKAAGLDATPPGHFATGDDAFYESHSGRMFHDMRWRTALAPDEVATIQANREIQSLLSAMGYTLTATGIAGDTGWHRQLIPTAVATDFPLSKYTIDKA